MIWFLSWWLMIVLISAGSGVYLWVLDADAGLISRQVDDLTPAGWAWHPGAFATPGIEAVLYLACVVFVGLRRHDLRHRRASDARQPGRLITWGQWLLANPSGMRLSAPFIPLLGLALALSAPEVQIRDGLSPFLWGIGALFWLSLIGTALFPDPAEFALPSVEEPIPLLLPPPVPRRNLLRRLRRR
jgi:hypothetical protein